MKDGYECKEVKNELKDGYECNEDRDELTGSVYGASLYGKNRHEPTAGVDDVIPNVEIGMSGQFCVNNCHKTLATIGACGRQHKGVVSLVLAGPTPGPVVRRLERLHNSADRSTAQYAELAEWCPMATRHLVTRVKQQRLPDLTRIADVRSGTAEQEDGATHKSTSSAREKPTKVNVDDEEAQMASVLCDEKKSLWRMRRWLCPWKAP